MCSAQYTRKKVIHDVWITLTLVYSLLIVPISCTIRTRGRVLTESVCSLDVHVQGLSQAAVRSQQEYVQLQETQVGKKQALERENDVLREQLKKYMTLAQAQLRELPARQRNTGMLDIIGQKVCIEDESSFMTRRCRKIDLYLT